MSLINREVLLSFEKMDADLCATCGEHHTAEDVIMMIKTAPTVDAVPVVRCRDCKHYDETDPFNCEFALWNLGGRMISAPTQNERTVTGMAEYIEREAAIESIMSDPPDAHYPHWYADKIKAIPAANVAPARHCLCGVCSGKQIITQDCDNGYSLEIDPEQSELAVWFGDQCIAVFSIDYCPICGAKMDGGS